ncbi:DUF2306 domain-containing protein [Bosea sp. R86505]|uniref:DUF2306 domain-containing protein n=1 Tax=Bosea sp. R86505 TaxID=3101710 RepID=UPI003670E337
MPTLAPLAAASPVIQFHVAAALLALASGAVVALIPKGTRPHRRLGWIFVSAMMLVALSSLLIARSGHFSAIHLLTLLTLISLPYAVVSRRRGNIAAHRSAMTGLLLGLVIAGGFTLLPGRLMHAVTFGQAGSAR